MLAKVYGIASMKTVTLYLMLPGMVVLLTFWIWAIKSGQSQLSRDLIIGFLGGLAGTIAYDLARVPFTFSGQRIFAPISAYGIWLLDSATSSRLTELVGWSYHFSNGITFGIMYALLSPGRHFVYAIIWAGLLETIAILSPFATIFHLSGNYQAIAIAYLGHLAYGLPLGLMIQKPEKTWNFTNQYRYVLLASLSMATAMAALWLLTAPSMRERDARVQPQTFRVEGKALNPDWLRIENHEQIKIDNSQSDAISVRVKQTNQTMQVESEQVVPMRFEKTGIYQIFIETDAMTRSSFIIVEPVEINK
ncbi:MAG: hypothetical protein AB1757_21945 [Acidobacteriota bacterium]